MILLKRLPLALVSLALVFNTALSSETLTVTEDGVLTITLASLSCVSEGSGDTSDYQIVSSGDHGTLSYVDSSGSRVILTDGATFQQADTSSLTFSMGLDYYGVDSLSFKTASGAIDCDVLVLVTPSSDDAPVAVDDSLTVGKEGGRGEV